MGKQTLKFKTDVAMMRKMGYDIRVEEFTPEELAFSKYEIKEINVQQRGEGRRPPFGGNSTRVYSGDYLMKAGLEIRVGRDDLSSNVYEFSVVE